VLISESLTKVLPLQIGEVAEICIGKKSSAPHNEISYNQCELMFRARIVGSIRRMPGMYDFSGFKPTAYMEPGVIVSEKQMRYLIDTYLARNSKAYESY